MRNTLLLALLFAPLCAAQVTITDPNFTIDTIANPGAGTICMEFGPGGRFYFAEKRGRIHVMQPNGSGGFQTATLFANIQSQVDYAQEAGLLGMALDPDFANNRFMYLQYTTAIDQRVTRVTADTNFNTMVAGSEVNLLIGLPRNATYHRAGDIGFRPGENDNLYVALGDDGNIGLAPNVDFYHGKMLRISKANGQGLTTNPFYQVATGTTSVRSRVWAVGFRNPFRIAFHPANPVADAIYASENGGPSNMSTNLQDRVTWIQQGADGAWNSTSATQGDASPFFNPPPMGGQECVVLHRSSSSKIGIDIAVGGVFADPTNPTSATLLHSNWLNGGNIQRWRISGTDHNVLNTMAADGGVPFVQGLYATDLKIGPDGWAYFTQSGNGESVGGWYTVGRIRRVGGIAPVAGFNSTPSPATGPVPFNVQFTDTSSDADGTIASRLWTFGNGQTSTATNPSTTYNSTGNYTVTLLVTDNTGLQDTETMQVTVYQATALTLTGQVFNASSLPPVVLGVATELRLYQADGTTPLSFPGGIGASGNAFVVAAGGTINNTVNVQLTGNGVVVSAGEPAADGMEPQRIGFAVSQSATTHSETLTFRLSSLAITGRVTTTTTQPALVDLGVARLTPSTLYAFGGGRDYLGASGIPATGVNHRTVSDVFGWYYIPLVAGDGGVTFHFDVVGDTGASSYIATIFSESIPATGLLTRNVTVGVLANPGAFDDLSGIGVTPNVDYETQIQPIWNNACTGCHTALGGSAGLALGQGVSYAALVSVASTQVPGLNLVEPGNTGLSYLFEKVNAHQPQVGVRMRPGTPMSLAEQALIRDWINQGALPSASGGGGGSGGSDSDGGGCTVEQAAGTGALCLLAFALLLWRRRPAEGADAAR